MDNTQNRQFVQLMMALASTFRAETSEAMLEGYWLGLEDLPFPSVKQAVVKAMRLRRLMPTVAELREQAGDLSPADRAPIAWDAVDLAMRRYGYTASVCFDDPATNAAIRNMGGWEKLSDRLDTEDPQWVRKDFERIYQVYCRRGVTASEGAHLPGFHERHNGFAGYLESIPKPARIETTLRPALQLEGPKRQRPAITTNIVALTSEIGRIKEDVL